MLRVVSRGESMRYLLASSEDFTVYTDKIACLLLTEASVYSYATDNLLHAAPQPPLNGLSVSLGVPLVSKLVQYVLVLLSHERLRLHLPFV